MTNRCAIIFRNQCHSELDPISEDLPWCESRRDKVETWLQLIYRGSQWVSPSNDTTLDDTPLYHKLSLYLLMFIVTRNRSYCKLPFLRSLGFRISPTDSILCFSFSVGLSFQLSFTSRHCFVVTFYWVSVVIYVIVISFDWECFPNSSKDDTQEFVTHGEFRDVVKKFPVT